MLENTLSILIDFLLIAVLIYVYRVNKTFFMVYILTMVLLIFLLPNIIIPKIVWEKLLI